MTASGAQPTTASREPALPTPSAPVFRNASVVPLPARWECAYGVSDDEPFCTDEDEGHACPTIRVHRDDAEQFAALVARVHELENELAATRAESVTEHGVRIGSGNLLTRHTDRDTAVQAAAQTRQSGTPATAVTRTVHYGPWTEAAS